MFGLSSFWKSNKIEPESTMVLEPEDQVTQTRNTGSDSSLRSQIDSDLNQAEEAIRQAAALEGVNESSVNVPEPTESPESIDDIDLQQAVLDRIALRPEGEFVLFEQAANYLPKRILEIGVDDGERASCLLNFCALVIPTNELFYFGMDWFEERTAEQRPGLEYMQAFQMFKNMGVATRLQPGDPGTGFLGVANSLTAKKVDWIMISEEIAPRTMRKLWPLFPRIIDDETRFFLEKGGRYRLVPPAEVNRIAQKAQKIQTGR